MFSSNEYAGPASCYYEGDRERERNKEKWDQRDGKAARTRSSPMTTACDTTLNPLVTFVKNFSSGLYEAIDAEQENNSIISVSSALDRATESHFEPGSVVKARLCHCSPVPGIYCPDGASMCNVTMSFGSNETNHAEIFCSEEHLESKALALLRVAIALFIFLFLYAFCSNTGRHGYVYLKRIICFWDDERYEQALNEEVDQMLWEARQDRRAAELMQRQVPNQMRFAGVGYIENLQSMLTTGSQPAALGPAGSTAVVLKTRVVDEEDTNAVPGGLECAICLQVIDTGQRVGEITCQHYFHVECLKPWIRRRRNYCPLCRVGRIAVAAAQPAQSNSTV